jgi:hypothetical protein
LTYSQAKPPTARPLLVAGVCLAWLLCAFAPLLKYLSHPKATAAMAIGVLGIALGMYWLQRLNRTQRQIHLAWFLLLFALFTTAFAIFHPLSLTHPAGRSSDREDALQIELTAVTHHQYPYDFRTFLGNKPTPLPGALWLAFPFFALGHVAWQNLFWLALFFLFVMRFFRHRATALLLLAVFLLLSPANVNDFVSGGDYLTNFSYIAIALGLFIRSLDRPLTHCIPAALFLGLTLSSRIVFAVILIPLLALTLQRTSRSRTLLLFTVALATAAAITLPVFTPHPLHHLLEQLNQGADKLKFIPSSLYPRQTLPLLTAALACGCFFVRMDLPRLFLAFSISSFVMLAPFVVTAAVHTGNLSSFSYLALSTLSFSLWALSQYEILTMETSKPATLVDL